MTKKIMEEDNWGQLLSEFGIEDQIQEETAPPEEPKPLSEPENIDETSAPREKKSIFSRFPKVNFFGAPPEVSLDSVIEGTKSPSLGGKAFTDNTLEKMPFSQERKERQSKARREEDAAKEPNAWSTVAAQIDTLASGENARTTSQERSTKRTVESMFDDPVPESEEFRALKSLMGEQSRPENLHRNTFREEESGTQRRGHGRRKPQPEEREVRGRGSRYRPPVEVDDLPESDFEMVDDEVPATRGRGRRGSRYTDGGYRGREPVQENVSQEEWSEIDAALQAGRGGPAPRGGRHQRYDKRRRPERADEPTIHRETLERGDSAVAAIHGDIPSWDEAIGDIIAGNIARHRAHGGRGRR